MAEITNISADKVLLGYNSTGIPSKFTEKETYELVLFLEKDGPVLREIEEVNSALAKLDKSRLINIKPLSETDVARVPGATDSMVRVKAKSNYQPSVISPEGRTLTNMSKNLPWGTIINTTLQLYPYTYQNTTGMSIRFSDVEMVSVPEITSTETPSTGAVSSKLTLDV